MPNYKLSVSKDWKKYNIVFKADNELLARERVHREWYSILGVEEVEKKEDIWNTFIFEWFDKTWALKHWKIVWNDILKVYVKLVKDLEYKIENIYPEKDEWKITDFEKNKIIKQLKEEYNLYYKWGKKDKIDTLREKLNKEKEERKKIQNFYLKKELDSVNKLIIHILAKLENFTNNKSKIEISFEQKQKLKEIYNSIIRLKKSTNITKLKEIWELALKKIWEIELASLEETKDEESRKFLKNTNDLLKQIGSKKHFIEKDKDIVYQTTQILKRFLKFLKPKKSKEENKWLDKNSHTYIKTKLFLEKYKEKKKENTIFIIKNIFKLFYNKDLREITFLKRDVIKQNIVILKAKLEWNIFSYTFLKKWTSKFIKTIMLFLTSLRKYLFLVIIIYTIIFLLYMNFELYFEQKNYNFDWIFMFLIIFSIYIILYLSKKVIFVIFNFVILYFIVIFGLINF